MIREKTRLPKTAKEIFNFTSKDWLIFNGTISFFRLTGLWRYPIPVSGDLETMTRFDMIYWMYKSKFPIKRATKNSGIEAFFEKQKSFRWNLPAGFNPKLELRLSAVGDLMDNPYLPNSAGTLYENVVDTIFDSDISMANLECVVYSDAVGPFTILPSEMKSPPLYYKRENFDAAKGILEKKYSFMATANNHSLDFEEAGVKSTIQVLKKEGIAYHGTNESEKDAASATVIERKGIKVGLISHTFGLNAKKPPREKPWIVNRTHLNNKLNEINFNQFEKQIQFCRENDVDMIIGQLHWGLEHEFYPRPEQLEVARHLAELGVDIVIGHHPHVVQPVEHYRTQRDPDRVVPIYYSLGNLITPFSHPDFGLSYVAKIVISKGVSRDGVTRTYVKDADAVEVFQEIDDAEEKIRLVKNKTRSERISEINKE